MTSLQYQEKVGRKAPPETMTPFERFQTAVALGKPDRTPVAPFIEYFAARYAGLSSHEYLFNLKANKAALRKTFDGLGGWDIMFTLLYTPDYLPFIYPLRARLPGVHLPPHSTHQLLEEPIMTVEDYDLVINKGMSALMDKMVPIIRPEISGERVPEVRMQMLQEVKALNDEWHARGIPTLIGGAASMPFGTFSFLRSFKEFTVDLYHHADKVQAACEAATEDIIRTAKASVAFTGTRIVANTGSRASSAYIGPKRFERFVLPSLKKVVESLATDGIISLLHFDLDWTPALPYLRGLPYGKCILELDGTTDIFKAKELLGDHMCLMGDVPAAMLSLGTAAEVEEYCKRLIDEIGKDGGFILSSGCSVPIDAKPENVKAIIDVAKSHRP